jgi:ferritin-like metal-binding protein YciE
VSIAKFTYGPSGYPMDMGDRSVDEQLTKYLTDAHSIEVQAIAQLERAPDIAGDLEISRILADHLAETEDQELLVRARLDARGAKPAVVKDVAGRAGGWGMILFARMNPDTPGKLTMHAFAYEHMELAAYELIRRIADRAGDAAVSQMASRIGEQERAMADRLGMQWDRAVEASLRAKGADDPSRELVKYLRDAHALEAQALQLLETGSQTAGFDALATAFREHLEQTRKHQRSLDERLWAHGAKPSRFQSGAMRAGAVSMGAFFKAQPDTPAKLAGFAYAFEALECGAYELLSRTARRAGDTDTAAVAERILAEERTAAQRVADTWDAAADAALRAQGVTGA